MTLNEPVLLHWIDLDVLSRLGIAALVGLGLGLDRELRGHPAGLRTHGLVCFSSAALAVSMLALYHQLDDGNGRMDALRMFEATGSFIGIVGAGLIVFSKGEVKNLTTAAHLWLTAVIGLSCGAGQWPLVIIGSVISLILLTLVGLMEKRFFPQDRQDLDR